MAAFKCSYTIKSRCFSLYSLQLIKLDDYILKYVKKDLKKRCARLS